MEQVILTYLGYDGNRKCVLVRDMKWNDLDHNMQRYLSQDEDFSVGQVVYQMGSQPVGGDIYWSGIYPTIERAVVQLPWRVLETDWHEMEIVNQELYDLACRAYKEELEWLASYQQRVEEERSKEQEHKRNLYYLLQKFIENSPLTKEKISFSWRGDDNKVHLVSGYGLYYNGKNIGLAIDKRSKGAYRINHLATGYSLTELYFGKLKDAMDFCSLILTCVDWTQENITSANDFYFRTALWHEFMD
jgi:hypothetical protein